MEPHATAAEWDGDEPTVYDATQSVAGITGSDSLDAGPIKEKCKSYISIHWWWLWIKRFYVGQFNICSNGGKIVNRPVKIVLQRTEQMFTCAGRSSLLYKRLAWVLMQMENLVQSAMKPHRETSFVDQFVENCRRRYKNVICLT